MASEWKRRSDAEHADMLEKIARQKEYEQKVASRQKLMKLVAPLSIALAVITISLSTFTAVQLTWRRNHCELVTTYIGFHGDILNSEEVCYPQLDLIMLILSATAVTLLLSAAIIFFGLAACNIIELIRGSEALVATTVVQLFLGGLFAAYTYLTFELFTL